MPDILHLVGIEAPASKVFLALSTTRGLAEWWTEKVSGDESIGGVLRFQFDDHGRNDMKVMELMPAQRVVWECVAGAPEWIGTHVSFDLKETEGETKLVFAQRGWREQGEFMHYCSTKWAMYLVGLKTFLETGRGLPYPRDARITRHF